MFRSEGGGEPKDASLEDACTCVEHHDSNDRESEEGVSPGSGINLGENCGEDEHDAHDEEREHDAHKSRELIL